MKSSKKKKMIPCNLFSEANRLVFSFTFIISYAFAWWRRITQNVCFALTMPLCQDLNCMTNILLYKQLLKGKDLRNKHSIPLGYPEPKFTFMFSPVFSTNHSLKALSLVFIKMVSNHLL